MKGWDCLWGETAVAPGCSGLTSRSDLARFKIDHVLSFELRVAETFYPNDRTRFIQVCEAAASRHPPANRRGR